MRVHSLSLGFLLLYLLSFCNADSKMFEIVGLADCADCQLNNFKTSHAFSGLHVTIDCKLEKGIKRVGDGELGEDGKFKISLPKEMIGDVKKKCYAQLHSASAGAAPCPAHGGIEANQIVFKSQIDDKLTKALQFSTALCTSKLFGYPPLPKKVWPKSTLKKHHWAHPPKPVKTPPVPVYNKPKPIPPPFHKPTPKPPVVTKPLPPPFPPLYRKPFAKIPPKYFFDHPKFGYFPKLPPFNTNP